MKTYQGKGAYGAIAMGNASVFRHRPANVPNYAISDVSKELLRLEEAIGMARDQLKRIREKTLRETDASTAQIFASHEVLLQDESFLSQIKQLITEKSRNAEYAVASTAKNTCNAFLASGDEFLSARAIDVTDVADRLIACLGKTERAEDDCGAKHGLILCAEDLTPSDTISLDKASIRAFVTASGSLTSHVAILAKSLRIPAIVGAGEDFLKDLRNGTEIIVDGFTGMIYLDPDDSTRQELLKKLEDSARELARLHELKGLESITLDGTRILIGANVNTLEELETVLDNDADGIGLFRSEFLYLGNKDYPSEEQQLRAYREVLERMPGKKVIIRTLDVGADKAIEYFHLDKEENPALGLRAIRLCLTKPEIFKTQLRALYRASVYGRLGILFPMIANVSEVEKILAICEEVKKELREADVPYDEKTELGIMIETPAAALISDLLAPMVDFFSVGTNDLTQYTLAVDRQNAKLDPFCDPRHEAVLRLIKMAADNAHANHARIGICGELAADFTLTETFLRMGIDELSVSASSVLPLRDVIRKLRLNT